MPRLNSYEEIVENYRWGARLKAMEELEYFAKLSSIEEAINTVADARKENGALFNHQRYLEQTTVEEVRRALLANQDAISRVADFDELIALVERLIGTISGAKEMYIYDTALRLGAFLKKMPERVYLHKGTRIGAEALGLSVEGRAWIAIEEVPPSFHVLPAYEIEDVLCSYKDDIKRIRKHLESRRPRSLPCLWTRERRQRSSTRWFRSTPSCSTSRTKRWGSARRPRRVAGRPPDRRFQLEGQQGVGRCGESVAGLETSAAARRTDTPALGQTGA